MPSDPTPQEIRELLAGQQLVDLGGYIERTRTYWVLYETGTAWTPKQARAAFLAQIRPMWCDDLDDNALWLYSVSMMQKVDDQTALLHAKFCSKSVNDPLRRAPGSERIHWVSGHDTQIAYKNVAVAGERGDPATNPIYIGFPWGSEGVHWIKPRIIYSIDKIYASNNVPSGTQVQVGTRNSSQYSTPGGANGNGTTTPYDLTMSPSTILGTTGTLLLLEVEQRLLENGNIQRLVTIAYDPWLQHAKVWYLRGLQRGVVDVNTPYYAQFSAQADFTGLL